MTRVMKTNLNIVEQDFVTSFHQALETSIFCT